MIFYSCVHCELSVRDVSNATVSICEPLSKLIFISFEMIGSLNNLLGNDIVKIAKAIRDAHGKDAETGERKWAREEEKIILKQHRYSSAHTRCTIYLYFSIMNLNYVFYDCKTKACTTCSFRSTFIHTVKSFKDSLLL